MPIQRKPEEIVPILLTRLEKAKQYAVETISNSNERDPLMLKFKEIEDQLVSMKRLFPRIKHWEEKLMEEFKILEQEIDNDDVFKQHGSVNGILEKLELINGSVVSIKELFSEVEKQLIDRIRSMSFSGLHFPFEEGGGKDQTMSEEWLKLGMEEKIFASKAMFNFQKSFDCLENHQLKACSLCLSVFPENSIIKKRPLIYWWIGEGMVTKTLGKTAEDVGEDVFKELINEGFIIPQSESSSPNVNSCTVHPWARRMLILVAKTLCFFEFNSIGLPINCYRRAFFLPGSRDLYSTITEDILTVFNVSEQYLGFEPDWLSKLNKVEVLQLGRWQNSVKHHIEVENEELVVVSKKKKNHKKEGGEECGEEEKHHHPFHLNHHKREGEEENIVDEAAAYKYEKEEKHHKHLEKIGELGAAAAGAYALHEKHEAKKDPEHAHRHKIEEEIGAAAAVGAGGFAFHEHHEKKEAKKEEEKAEGKHHHHLF